MVKSKTHEISKSMHEMGSTQNCNTFCNIRISRNQLDSINLIKIHYLHCVCSKHTMLSGIPFLQYYALASLYVILNPEGFKI